ncbi:MULTISPECIES: IclR family transcriptional regulator [unclassified Bradyrhizobium]|uniref:IclR family transcriptional regulator n=1 Tax=unclassified Bradyrhizobium TaxID=2631580 RepID=UPI0015C75C1E|nr:MULTISPECIES: helix-turn-helix domain-containing protein [unclassified Bradyrhizobium]MBB4260530.1 DNA-binding IclR family transcriptional regulator [Bradyrhizobium sp. CIR3A]NYG46800.1 DNA-binding IclR family transcriptional regulator [Bradyrhizobium sp. IAR9]
MAASTPRKIKSAERTLALFELFSREQQPFTVGRIAKGLGIPQPSVSMLLRNLLKLGYLEYDAHHRTFAPSIRVALLGSWIDRRFGDAGAIGARLNELQRRLGFTAFIAIQNGAAAQYVLAQTSDEPDRLDISSGMYRSLTCSAAGRALLSLLPDAEIRSWVRRCNAEATEDRFRVGEADFIAMMHRARAEGYAETNGDSVPTLSAVAMTIVSPMGGTPLAVGVGGPTARIRTDKDAVLAALDQFVSGFARPSPAVSPAPRSPYRRAAHGLADRARMASVA